MTSPETNKKFILDATAGFRMMHYDKQNPNVLFMDKRAECQPEHIANFKNTELPSNSFYLIIWDPPYLVSNGTQNAASNMKRMYGLLEPETWQADLREGFTELWRLLKPGGTLMFKWSTYSVSSDRVLDLFPIKPIVYQISANKKNGESMTGKRVREVQTLWFCFFKNPAEVV